MDESFHITPDPEQVALGQRRALLRNQLAKLYEERAFATGTEGPNLLSLYYREVGYLEVECLKLDLHIARNLREIECITAALNRDEPFDATAIHRQVEEEFLEWQARINEETRKLAEARDRISSLMGPEETAEIRKRYRALVMQLHPDIHPERHPAMRNLWERLQSAYTLGDLAEIRLIENLVAADLPDSNDAVADPIQEEITRLQELCKMLIDHLAEIRRQPPHTFRDLLEDPSALTTKKKALETKQLALGKREAALREYLAHLKGEIVHE